MENILVLYSFGENRIINYRTSRHTEHIKGSIESAFVDSFVFAICLHTGIFSIFFHTKKYMIVK